MHKLPSSVDTTNVTGIHRTQLSTSLTWLVNGHESLLLFSLFLSSLLLFHASSLLLGDPHVLDDVINGGRPHEGFTAKVTYVHHTHRNRGPEQLIVGKFLNNIYKTIAVYCYVILSYPKNISFILVLWFISSLPNSTFSDIYREKVKLYTHKISELVWQILCNMNSIRNVE